ncbi:MAG: type II toxin-antitoxin system PemK/MazF family toxin [Prochloraceae cyanobacterium]|nr:type II toxin-antitoxin system PemK/MazF family toxin [Prochloraceae cyanobacterium]
MRADNWIDTIDVKSSINCDIKNDKRNNSHYFNNRPSRRIYPSQIVIAAPEGGFDRNTIALSEQLRAISQTRLLTKRGTLSSSSLERLNKALLITLD